MLEKNILQDYKKSGSIIAEAIQYGTTLIKPEINILDTCLAIEKKIIDLGGGVAFPAQISIDHVAAHWCPEPEDETTFEEGQLVKLDIGCHINGRIADTAISLDLSDDKRHEELITAATKARDEALKIMTPGTTLGEIGETIQNTISQAGFSPIRNLSGHGLDDYEVHTWPSVPNINTGDHTELEEDMILAVEPFATTGEGRVQEIDRGNIFALTNPRPVRNQYARKAMKFLEPREGMPFSLHYLAKELGIGPAKFAMRELLLAEAAEQFPPLIEVRGGIVSQAEHSVIIADKPIIFTKK